MAIPSVRLSVRLSITWVDQSKTVEARIMQFSLYSSPIPLVFRRQVSSRNCYGVPRAGASKEGGVGQKSDFSTFVQQYLENGARYVQSYYWSLIGRHTWAFDWHQDRWPWMTLNCCKVEFSRNFVWFLVFGPTTKICMQIDPYCQQRKCSPMNVLSSNIRVMQLFAGVREIWGLKQESGRLRCRFLCLSLAIFSESSSPRLKSATYSICVKLLHKHDKLTQCCRTFTLALARLSCRN